ncbi:hypothetical protein LUZ63_001090 [Rhynchospora breviuscula]|uniref:DNA-directed RNA polymerase subunit beta n=1 Tax=Rhynchospora breviuscula TaxID=2022672 RepID=A0A9Q0CWC2_9POAL|nr:hypothetical protein LUZ63_001090 [Rhynchospora breviuscula]
MADIASTSQGPTDMDIDLDPVGQIEKLEKFSKEAARAFFEEFGLISHQISSYNNFVEHGIQDLFDSLGEFNVEPGYDPSKKGDSAWKHATISFGKVRLERPTFWNTKGDVPEMVKLTPRHARLQNMTYSAPLIAEMKIQVYTHEGSDKGKTGTSSSGKVLHKGGDKGKTGSSSSPGKVSCSDEGKTGSSSSGMGTYMGRKVLHDETKEIMIGRIPVMVRSVLCWLNTHDKGDCFFESGGYFLIKGMEKTFIAQEQRCLTRIWLTNTPSWNVGYVTEFKRSRVYCKLAEAGKGEGFNGGRYITISFLYATFPIWILFFALGVTSDKEVLSVIGIEDLDASLVNIILATVKEAGEQCKDFRNVGKAREYVDQLVKSSKFPPTEPFDEYVDKYLFKGIEGLREKALFLGYMVKCLLLGFSGKRKCDNKDDFRNKRLECAGELIARELRAHIWHAEKRMIKSMQRDLCGDRELRLDDLDHYWDSSIVTNGLNRSFSTGAWCHPYKRTERCSGIVANLRRTNPLQMMSDLRKSRQQVAYAGKAGDARYPNPSYWGKLCFLSTPDGENCGLVKNLSVTAIVSSKITSPMDHLVSIGMVKLNSVSLTDVNTNDKVLLNGDWVGVCRDGADFVKKFRLMRRSKIINPQVEIKRDRHQREVRIFSDSGRILRPLLIVENLEKIRAPKAGGSFSFQSLMDQGIIELIGVEEEEDIQSAWEIKQLFAKEAGKPVPKYSHVEFDQSFLLGLSCGLIPFANHNFARRVLYQAEKHSQQAIGYSTTNPNIRIDTLSHQMYYPQRPLFKTFLADCLGRHEYSSGRKDDFIRPEFFNGQNAIVAVNVHQGYNQEDSIVMNKASLERGMFRTEHHRTYKSEIDGKELSKRLKKKDNVIFGKIESKKGRVDSLDDDGLPFVGASLQSGDIVIGKVSESGEDFSVKLRHTEKGMVQKVVMSSSDDDKNFAFVTLRQVRSPCLGDKFSSMHGQKGVVGFLESQENFPFTHQGIVPDIVINPHAFPTRQTPGQLLEAALGKGIALGGQMQYATPFSTASPEDISEQLHKAGFVRWGSERVLNGRTGEMVQSLIFIGPTFYQRLIHMAEDKVKFRNTGPVHPLTRQPVADRKRFGGVKFGEMERDCLLAHGAAANLHERLFTLSDFSQMHICQTCKRVANVIMRPSSGGKKVSGPYCAFCKSAENIVRTNVPYGAKLLYQELFSMGICLKFETEVC